MEAEGVARDLDRLARNSFVDGFAIETELSRPSGGAAGQGCGRGCVWFRGAGPGCDCG